MADKVGVAASYVKDALLVLAPDDEAKRIVWEVWRKCPDDQAKLRTMTSCMADGLLYGNYPWVIGVRNR